MHFGKIEDISHEVVYQVRMIYNQFSILKVRRRKGPHHTFLLVIHSVQVIHSDKVEYFWAITRDSKTNKDVVVLCQITVNSHLYHGIEY